MKTLNFEQQEKISANGWIEKSCVVLAAGSTVYTIGIATNWWNPVGWVSGVAAVGTLGCAAYVLAN